MTASTIILNVLAPRHSVRVILNHVQRRNMPVNVPPTATGKRRFRLAVETDPHKLVNYCCGLNYHIDQPPIELKADSEYPDWLWNLRLGPKPHSWELKEGTKEYYLQLNEEEREKNYRKRMTAAQEKKVVSKVLKGQAEYVHRLRFAALAHLEDDAGLEIDSMEHDWVKDTCLQLRKSDYYLPPEEDRVIYMDEVKGNRDVKNYYRDNESSFNEGEVRMTKFPRNRLKPIQDSKRRHRYATT